MDFKPLHSILPSVEHWSPTPYVARLGLIHSERGHGRIQVSIPESRRTRQNRPSVAAFPDSTVGSACTSTFSRLAWRSLALRPAHSRGHQFVTAIRRLQPFRYLHDCSDCFRLERIAGWALHPLESAALSRRTPKPAGRLPWSNESNRLLEHVS